MMTITLATAGILGLIYIAISANVSAARRKTGIMMGDGTGKPGAEPLVLAMRIHANFAEYVPLALILLAGIELAGGGHRLLTVLAAVLVHGAAGAEPLSHRRRDRHLGGDPGRQPLGADPGAIGSPPASPAAGRAGCRAR